MPLNQTDHGDDNWGELAIKRGWHSTADPHDDARRLVIRDKLVPYGSYVTYNGRLYVETVDQLEAVMNALKELHGG